MTVTETPRRSSYVRMRGREFPVGDMCWRRAFPGIPAEARRARDFTRFLLQGSPRMDDVILAGHSYAGTVVTGVADRIPERLARVVFVDSAPLADGMAMTDLFPPEALAGMKETVERYGDGWKLPFPGWEIVGAGASLEGISDEDLLSIEARAEPMPWGTYTQPLRLEHKTPEWLGTIIACDDMRSLVEAGEPMITQFTQPPWQWIEMQTGHWPMFSAPDDLAEILNSLAPEEVEAD